MTKNDPVFGEITHDLGHWEKPLNYEIFETVFPLTLLVSCWDDEEILPCQRAAYQRFIGSNIDLTQLIEKAIFDHYLQVAPEVRERTGPEFSSTNAPAIDAVQDMVDLVKPTDLLINRPLSDPKRIVGLLFNCSWDIDNGLAVKIEDEQIVEVGPQDIVI